MGKQSLCVLWKNTEMHTPKEKAIAIEATISLFRAMDTQEPFISQEEVLIVFDKKDPTFVPSEEILKEVADVIDMAARISGGIPDKIRVLPELNKFLILKNLITPMENQVN